MKREDLLDLLRQAKQKAFHAKDKAEDAEADAANACSEAKDAESILIDLLSEINQDGSLSDDGLLLRDAQAYEVIDRLREYVEAINEIYKDGLGMRVKTALKMELTIIESLFSSAGWGRP